MLTTLVEIVIAITLAEAIVLTIYHRRTGRGVPLNAFGLNLLSGLMLMFALRTALSSGAWYWPVVFLSAAGIFHAADMWRRWRT